MNKTFSKKRISLSGTAALKKMFRERKLHTVCESALCPNIGECFAKNTATFLICGDVCTRNCEFCGVDKGKPAPLDKAEPGRISDAIKKMGLKYTVITSVTRDDLKDGGAGHFAATVNFIRENNQGVKVEVLVPDFNGDQNSGKKVFTSKPDVFSHNIETVPSLYKKVRNGADYKRSLNLLKLSAENGLLTKSGLMLGLGETDEEILSSMKDILSTGCKILTLGQYLAPTNRHYTVKRIVADKEFQSLKKRAEDMGFTHCASGTYVRSSYLAETMI